MNNKFMKNLKPPKKINDIIRTLNEKGFEAFLVGGCVRDILLKKTPKDWDITTNAKPEEIEALFEETFYENKFGTVGIKDRENKTVYEVTTYRIEKDYTDFRRPNKIEFSDNLLEDLKRRDFTINAIAYNHLKNEIIDPFNGQADLNKKLVKSVLDPEKRLREDALRLLRATRFANALDFKIEEKTKEAIVKNADLLGKISKERIKDEFKKIILSKTPAKGVKLLKNLKLLEFVLPELQRTVGVNQNLHHKRTVFSHLLHSLQNCPSKKLSVRLACLLHDIGKPQTKRGNGPKSTFYNHEYAGAKIAYKALKRLRFSEKIAKQVSNLIRNHMFYYEVDEVTASSVRRVLNKVGKENIHDLMNIRIADRLGSDCPKAKTYKLRHFEYLVDKVSQDPISVKMLKVNGKDLYQKAEVEKGPKMGAILDILLAFVLDDPKKNKEKFLLDKAKELNDFDIKELRKKAREKINEEKEKKTKNSRTDIGLNNY